MIKLPKTGVRGRPWAATRRFQGWVATWAQDRRRIRLQAANASPVPLTVPGLKLWVRVESLAGFADSSAVASWSDESGNGKHLAQAVAGSRPIYKAVGDGSPAVLFDGINDVLASAGNVFATNLHTIFLVARPLVSATNDAVGTGTVTDGDVLLMVGYADRMRGHTWRVGNANPPTDGVAVLHPGAFGIFEQEVTATNLFLRLTGALDGSRVLVGGLVGTSKPVYLGSRNNAWFFNGYVRALLVYEGNPSSLDKDRIREFLISAYNIPVPYPPPPVPGAPTDLNGENNGGGGVYLYWTTVDTAYVSEVRVERKLTSEPDSTYGEIITVGPGDNEYTDYDVEPSTYAGGYTYRVRSYGPGGFSPYSNTVVVLI